MLHKECNQTTSMHTHCIEAVLATTLQLHQNNSLLHAHLNKKCFFSLHVRTNNLRTFWCARDKDITYIIMITQNYRTIGCTHNTFVTNSMDPSINVKVTIKCTDRFPYHHTIPCPSLPPPPLPPPGHLRYQEEV